MQSRAIQQTLADLEDTPPSAFQADDEATCEPEPASITANLTAYWPSFLGGVVTPQIEMACSRFNPTQTHFLGDEIPAKAVGMSEYDY